MNHPQQEQQLAENSNIVEHMKMIHQQLCILSQEVQALKPPLSKIIGTAEAGRILGKSPRTIRQWYKDGRMPKTVNLGGNLEWEREMIEKMASTKKKGGRPRGAC